MMPLDLSDPIKKLSTISRIVSAYRWYLGTPEKPMRPKKFAAKLSLPLTEIGRILSPAHIRCWEKDFTIPHDEDLEDLIRCADRGSWQYHFARDMKAAKFPWRYAPSSEIGIRILGRDKPLMPDNKGS